MPKKFTDEVEQEICKKYLSGISSIQLAKEYRCSDTNIGRILKRNNIQTRSIKCNFNEEIEKEICQKYESGMDTVQLGKEYNCANSTISRLLKKHKIPIIIKRFTNEVEQEICQKYISKNTCPELSIEYNCSNNTILNILKRNKIKIKDKKRFTNEVEQEICQKYISKNTCPELSIEYNCSNNTILNILKRNKIKIKDKKRFTNEVEQEICQKYKDGRNTYELGKEYDCSNSTIHYILKRNNINARTISEAVRKYTLDESYFDIIDNTDKTYWLGWLYADGCNFIKKHFHTVTLALQERDKSILETFKKYLKIKIPLIYRPEEVMKEKGGNVKFKKDGTHMISQVQYSLKLNSKKISESLTRLGCVQRKSLILTFPTEEQVPEHLLSHFIRGYFEGDGSVSFNTNPNCKSQKAVWLINIVGTKEFLEGIKNWLLKNGLNFVGITKLNKNSKSNTWILQIQSILDILKFKELIYDDYLKENNTNSELVLQRKYNKLIDIQNYINNNKNIVNQINKIKNIKTFKVTQNIIDLYLNEKYSPYKIAEKYNVSYRTVIRLLTQNNISLRV